MGFIRIHGMAFYGYHGVSPAEKELAGKFSVDVEFPLDTKKAAKSDSLEDTVNYELIYKTVEAVITENKFHLVETLSELVAECLINGFDLTGIIVRVRKNHPPFPGHLDFVEIEVRKGDMNDLGKT
ncbi:MAG: dihydroneopterin aldolase [Candidatus Zixiibacteriota bacterium]